jgi:arylsulfatase A
MIRFPQATLTFLVTLGILAMDHVHATEGERRSVGHPNIVVILTDDLGYGDVAHLNPESKIQTPQLDALAAEGVTALDAHSPSAVCSPSRYAMLTGRYAWRGVLKAGRLDPWDEPVIETNRPTLATLLDAAGYDTAFFGKWHLGFLWPWKDGQRPSKKDLGNGDTSKATNAMFDWSKPIQGGPIGAGFDYYFGVDVPNMPPYAFIENDKLTCEPVDVDGRKLKVMLKAGHIHGSGPGQAGWQLENIMPELTTRVGDYIGSHAKKPKPFFLVFSMISPHTPIVPTKEFQGKSGAGLYGDYVVQTDDAIGKVVAALKKAGVFENTLVVVSSDNGPEEFTRELARTHQHSPAGPLRGMKRDLLEGGHRLPFIASWPDGGISGGRRIDVTISLTDLFATLAAATGSKIPNGAAEDSIDLLPALRENKPVRSNLVYHAANGKLALREDDWVYLRRGGNLKEPEWYLRERGADPLPDTPLLFNLAEDPRQFKNLAGSHSERLTAMEAKLQSIER